MKIKIVLCAVAVVSLLAAATYAQAAKAEDAPKLVIKQTEHNFGEVKKGEIAQHAFVVKNEGKADLEIKNVAPS